MRNVVAGFLALHILAALVLMLTRESWLPQVIGHAPNAGKAVAALESGAAPLDHVQNARDLRIDVEPPAASLSVRVLEPTPAGEAPPHATIFVLHGIRDSKRSMQGLGRRFSNAGYRVVLVDLRGQGQSTGDWLSYGAIEGRDMVQLADALASRGLLTLPIGVYGPSYGGSVALEFARHDRRVRAVVTVSTFTSMRDVVPLYGERIAPSWFVSRGDLRTAIDRAGVLGDYRPDDADSVAAIARTDAQVLLVHGRADRNIPWEHSQKLHDAAPTHSRLFIVERKDHRTIMSDASVREESVAWFDRWLVPGS